MSTLGEGWNQLLSPLNISEKMSRKLNIVLDCFIIGNALKSFEDGMPDNFLRYSETFIRRIYFSLLTVLSWCHNFSSIRCRWHFIIFILYGLSTELHIILVFSSLSVTGSQLVIRVLSVVTIVVCDPPFLGYTKLTILILWCIWFKPINYMLAQWVHDILFLKIPYVLC